MFSSIRKSSKDQKDEIAISNGTQISLSDYKTVTLHRYKNEPLVREEKNIYEYVERIVGRLHNYFDDFALKGSTNGAPKD